MGEKRDTKRVEGVEHTPTWHRVGLFGRIMYGKHKSQSVGLENTVDKSIDESGSLRASVSQESLVSTLSGTPETGSYGYQVALRREKRSGVLRTLVGYHRVNVTSRQLWLFGDTLGTCYMCRA
ncbi:hypothetical protein V1477_006618 [Vespula maculifrons]|uniref:Uncharacterized protein n=1 Tax=Vespula maculifrons TaxID=7453 RepID=A0ABD2CJL1_VESMC